MESVQTHVQQYKLLVIHEYNMDSSLEATLATSPDSLGELCTNCSKTTNPVWCAQHGLEALVSCVGISQEFLIIRPDAVYRQ